MSEIKVNALKKRNGSTITIGESGDVVTITPGVTGTTITSGTVANARLVGSGAITINGSAVSLGGSVVIGETKPTVTGVTPSAIPNTATNVVIAGTNFVSVPQVEAISSTGAITAANTVTFTSATSITANFTLPVDGAYFIRVENNDGNAVRSGAILTVSDAPSWTTGAGSLGTIAGNFSGTVATVAASGDAPLAFSETTNVLTNASQANCSLNSSTGVITTTDFGGSSTSATTYNFTLRVTDAEGQTADRAFSLTSSFELDSSGRFGD
tara:strand:+ start:65 stop:871 length:807 start_codon:yes stop_codon:yes gene_type:complete